MEQKEGVEIGLALDEKISEEEGERADRGQEYNNEDIGEWRGKVTAELSPANDPNIMHDRFRLPGAPYRS